VNELLFFAVESLLLPDLAPSPVKRVWFALGFSSRPLECVLNEVTGMANMLNVIENVALNFLVVSRMEPIGLVMVISV
jgi:hypothetical protein